MPGLQAGAATLLLIIVEQLARQGKATLRLVIIEGSAVCQAHWPGQRHCCFSFLSRPHDKTRHHLLLVISEGSAVCQAYMPGQR